MHDGRNERFVDWEPVAEIGIDGYPAPLGSPRIDHHPLPPREHMCPLTPAKPRPVTAAKVDDAVRTIAPAMPPHATKAVHGRNVALTGCGRAYV